eukprot:m.264579 g.264579  ORF g.264579 m.264579 type:complete len:336 (+) comp15618_c0_seq8:659-1666(+)
MAYLYPETLVSTTASTSSTPCSPTTQKFRLSRTPSAASSTQLFAQTTPRTPSPPVAQACVPHTPVAMEQSFQLQMQQQLYAVSQMAHFEAMARAHRQQQYHQRKYPHLPSTVPSDSFSDSNHSDEEVAANAAGFIHDVIAIRDAPLTPSKTTQTKSMPWPSNMPTAAPTHANTPSVLPSTQPATSNAVGHDVAAVNRKPNPDKSAKYVFDCYPFPMTWSDAMSRREAAQQRFLKLERGRRASRNVRKRKEPSSDEESDEADGSVDTSCPYCHKSYRQNNSFYKHLYEHHPQWSTVSKTYSLSKHQQVMMMQTAELLLSLRNPEKHGVQPLVRFEV